MKIGDKCIVIEDIINAWDDKVFYKIGDKCIIKDGSEEGYHLIDDRKKCFHISINKIEKYIIPIKEFRQKKLNRILK